MELPVRLSDTHFKVTLANGVNVKERPAGTFDRAADAMRFAFLIDQTTDCTTRGIINTGNATSPNGDKHPFRLGIGARASSDG